MNKSALVTILGTPVTKKPSLSATRHILRAYLKQIFLSLDYRPCMKSLITCRLRIGNKIAYCPRNGPECLINDAKGAVACRGVIDYEKNLIGKVDFLEQLPRMDNGKLYKRHLQDAYREAV